MRSIGLLVSKDLRVLWRSRGLLAALVLYPIVLALLVALVADEAGTPPAHRLGRRRQDPRRARRSARRRSTTPGCKQRVGDRVDVVDMEAGAAQQALDDGRVAAVVNVPSSLPADLRTSVVQPQIAVIVRDGANGERALREVERFVNQLNSRVQRRVAAHRRSGSSASSARAARPSSRSAT